MECGKKEYKKEDEMKKLLLMAVIVINIFATTVEVKCIEGYKYVIVTTENGVAITQVYNQDSGKYTYTFHPVKCRK